jgi:hypothetical protein
VVPWSLFVPPDHGIPDQFDDLVGRGRMVLGIPAPSENTAILTLIATSAPWPFVQSSPHKYQKINQLAYVEPKSFGEGYAWYMITYQSA